MTQIALPAQWFTGLHAARALRAFEAPAAEAGRPSPFRRTEGPTVAMLWALRSDWEELEADLTQMYAEGDPVGGPLALLRMGLGLTAR